MGRLRLSYIARTDIISVLGKLSGSCVSCEDVTVNVDSTPLNISIKSNDLYGQGDIETTISQTETFPIKINGHKSKEDNLNKTYSSVTVSVKDARNGDLIDMYELTRNHTGTIC